LRIPRLITIISSVVALAVIVAVVYVLTRPRGAVVTDASVSLSEISPNADRDADATRIDYSLRREALVSIYFEDEDGNKYFFRDEEIRTRGDYNVLFSGIVDGFVLPGEDVEGDVMQRLIPDGEYTWVVQAEDTATGQVDDLSGTLIIDGGDPVLPDLWEFSVSPDVFEPNQDGIKDRVEINIYIPKDASLTVYLVDQNDDRIYIPEFQETRLPGEEGRHSFEYDGGIDNGSNPPPDGRYTVVAEAVDDEGQQVMRTDDLEIQNGGIPLAEIVGQPGGDTLRFSSETVIQGDVLYFEVTVENYGDAPIRTTGPASGHVYEQTEIYTSTGYFVESGAWRVGIHCETCLTDYPWRWSLGDEESLTAIVDDRGNTQYYLMPGERAVISGGIRLTEIVESRNPQNFWAGLIHEDVGIAPLNNAVDPHSIEIVPVDSFSG